MPRHFILNFQKEELYLILLCFYRYRYSVVKNDFVKNVGAGSVHLAELQHALAASCRATPRLRHAWLATLAEHNARHCDHDEVTPAATLPIIISLPLCHCV
jgi:hypothetical protein